MSESPTRRIVASAAGGETASGGGEDQTTLPRHLRGSTIKPRHRSTSSSPPQRSQLLKRLVAVAFACALVGAVVRLRAPPSRPAPTASSTSSAKLYVSPLPESAVAAAAKVAGEITATTAAAFGLPGSAASSSLRGSSSSSTSVSKLPLPSVGLPKPPRAEKHPDDDEHAGETQQAFLKRVLLDPVEVVENISSSFSSTVPPPAPIAAKAIKAATAHAWAGYVAHAWGEDELAPLSREGYETFCSLAVTAVDSLDTLWLMGMHREFDRARSWLLENLPGRLRKNPCAVSVFEATIRVVGGLAAAADLSGDGGSEGYSSSNSSSSSPSSAVSSLGNLAVLAAEALLPAFNVPSPTDATLTLALPVSEVDLGSGEPLVADVAAFGPDGASGTALLAEAGSLAPEFWRAGYWRAVNEQQQQQQQQKGGKKTNKSESASASAAARLLSAAGASAVDAVLRAHDFAETPLPPTTLSLSDASAAWSERHTVGGRTDSYYEYLLKMWLMLRRAAEAEAEVEEGGEVEGVDERGAEAAARNSSSLSSNFIRDVKAEAEALSYIPSSDPIATEEEKHGHHHQKHSSHHTPRHHNHGGGEKSPQTSSTPLARRAELYRRAWLAAVDEILEKLVRETPGGSRYPTSDMGEPVMEHLACFFPGNVALGVMSGAVSGRRQRASPPPANRDEEEGREDLDGDELEAAAILEKEASYLAAADALAETCALAGETTATGLAPEVALFLPEIRPGHPFSVLRPEAVESFFYLWRATKDPKWRLHGWKTFRALEKHAKVASGGFSGIRDVTVSPTTKDDSQPSWLLAETFKYLFLLFSEDSVLDLNAFVLNTEAHPLRVFGERRKKEKKKLEEGGETLEGEEEFGRQRLPRGEEAAKSSSSSSRRHLKP